MPFNPSAAYRTVVDAEGALYISQGGKYYNKQGDELPALPRTAQGYGAPTDPNLTVAATTVFADTELGYSAAAQGTVTQLTSKTTAVSLNKSMGRITMNAASLTNGTSALFTLNNTLIGPNDVVVVTVSSGGTSGAYWPFVASQTTGSAVIGLYNNTAGPLSEAVVVSFAIIHGV